MKHETREAWLKAAATFLTPTVEKASGTTIDKGLQIFVSWPLRSTQAGGQFFPKAYAKEAKVEHVIVSPVLGIDRVLDVLLHELVHAALPKHDGHAGEFKRVAEAVGLVGPMRSSKAGADLEKTIAELLKKLGPYPHHVMVDKHRKKAKKKVASIVKFVSPVDSAYSAWVSPRQAEEHGGPICPISKKPMVLTGSSDEEEGGE